MTIKAQSESKNVPQEWQTLAEQTDYKKSWNYADTIAFANKLAKSVATESFINRSAKAAKAEICRC